jgi:hypothetical protein
MKKIIKNIFMQKKPNPNDFTNWVDKCNFVLDNFKKYERIYLIFDLEVLMFFCNYYLLDGFNDLGYKNIIIIPNQKQQIVSYFIEDTFIWNKTDIKKLKLNLGSKILPLHFTVYDFSLNLIQTLNNDAFLTNMGKKNQGVKTVYNHFKNVVNETVKRSQ